MATMTTTDGQALTAELRRYFSVGTRTRKHRNGHDLHADMIEALRNATIYPGYYTTSTNAIFASAWAIACAYGKHIEGYRIDGTLHYRIATMTPYQFAALLGRMVDAGVQNNGDAERFFVEMAREAR
jgi:hypothetical protein